jgi:tetratricopeptide (TPR) repeat protein
MRPIDTVEIRKCIKVFDDLEKQFGKNPYFFGAFFKKANLLIYYLNEPESGKKTLEEMFQMPLNPHQKGDINLMLGDVFLIEGDYNSARLKYGEVEESFKQDQTGARAKYKGALLSYFRGDFDLSSARLKSLKENTANDIANDAIKLNLLIQDNTGLDSTTDALQGFARAQLLIYQNRNSEAMTLLDSILFAFPKHSLTDEIYWEKANIFLKGGKIEEATRLLDKILKEHTYDILADDALFTLAEIQELHFKNKSSAADLYLKVLSDYPGSLFKVEARKRIRQLRGESL